MQKRNKLCIIAVFFTCLMLNFAFFIPNKARESIAEKQNELTSAKAMVVMEQSSKRVLYSHCEEEKLSMASTTKIITCIYVLEHTQDLDQVYEIPKEATKISGTSIGLVEGEHLSIRELLYGLMLRSGNDSAVALAILTSGSEEKFIQDVNQYLQELGAVNTKIKNPHGLTADGHETTALDLARITAYAMNNETFREIVSTKEKTISNEKKSKFSRNLKNKNKLLKDYDGANGVKTGYTVKAGRCFVGSATRNGMNLICVLLNCVPMFEECSMLFDKAFKEYEMVKLIDKDQVYAKIKTLHSDTKEINLKSEEDFFFPLSKSEKQKIKLSVISDKTLEAPIQIGQGLGELQITLENQLIFSHKIYNINNIENNMFITRFKKIVQNM